MRRGNALPIDSLREILNTKIYSSLSEAIQALEKRRDNKKLREEINNFLGNRRVPDIISKNKSIPAVLFRQLASPNYEMSRFLALAELGDFTPVVWEYLDDKYVTLNSEKYSLGKMSFYHGINKQGTLVVTKLKIVDFPKYDGKKISDVKTIWGETLADFHHSLLPQLYEGKVNYALFDASKWFQESGNNANHYYDYFLSLFIRNALLFENFLIDGTERQFTERVVIPAFERVYNRFKVKPLIIALDPTEVEGDHFWRCYPPTLEPLVKAKII